MPIAAMWEARAVPGRGGLLADWVHAAALPAISGLPGLERVEVFTASDDPTADRVVVIALWTDEVVDLPDPPAALIARPVHVWRFDRLSIGP